MGRKNQRRIINHLRKHRKTRGLRQKDVASILGLKSSSMISRWENGVCMPRSENMFKLAVLYRTMADALFIDLRRSIQEQIKKAEEELLKGKLRHK